MLTDVQVYKITTELFNGNWAFNSYTIRDQNVPSLWVQKAIFIFQALNKIDGYDFALTVTGPFSNKLNDDFYFKFVNIGNKTKREWDKIKLKDKAQIKIDKTKEFLKFGSKVVAKTGLTKNCWVGLSASCLYLHVVKKLPRQKLEKKLKQIFLGSQFSQFTEKQLDFIIKRFYKKLEKISKI